MKEHLGSIQLRNEHKIFFDGVNYFVESPVGKSGEIIVKTHSKQKIDEFANFLQGMNVSVEEATNHIMRSQYVDLLNYQYGYKAGYEVQDILLCIIASGRGKHSKKGREYRYEFKTR